MCRAAAAFISLPLALSFVAPARQAVAQSVDTISVNSTGRLFTRGDLLLGLAFAGLTIAMKPVDERAAKSLQRDPIQNRALLKNSATAFRLLGNPGSPLTAAALYAVGRVAHQRRVADFGLHITESIMMSTVITDLVKGAAGRARPRVFVDTAGAAPFDPNPNDFEFARGFRKKGEYQSFPSGHTSAAFAFASAMVSEISKWKPGAVWYAGPIFYGGATLVGASRMYNNAHWASDVALGAAIGTFSGLKVVRFNHHHAGNRLDRALLSARLTPGDGSGIQLGWSILP